MKQELSPLQANVKQAIKNLPNNLVTNKVDIKASGTDNVESKTKQNRISLSMSEILQRTRNQTGNWPRRVEDVLFVHDEHGISYLEKTHSLFGWLHSSVGRVQWSSGSSTVKQTELFSELRRMATAYENVEVYPHQPRFPNHYYAYQEPIKGNGTRIRELIERFAPATLVDWDLILSAFITPGWGGPPGCRPCYVITSQFGRGVGKTTLAEMVGLLWGGALSLSHHEDIQKIKTRLLTPNAMTKRVCILDNIKSLKFSWSELEHVITATSVDGHRMYHGNGTRPNTFIWFVTLNGASLSTDLAQRSVIIELDKPKRSASWLDETRQFIEQHRAELISDIIRILRSKPAILDKFSRWATWEREILARLSEPSDCQKVIAERQDAVDVEAEEADNIEEEFARHLRLLGYNPDRDWIFICNKIANEWLCLAQNDRLTTTQSSRILNQMAKEGRLKQLEVNLRCDLGRGFLWATDETGMTINVDLESRITKNEWGRL